MTSTLIANLSPEAIATLNEAWSFWGMDLQITILEEELAELSEALTIVHLKGAWTDAAFEELADVLVCLSQVEIALRAKPFSIEKGQRTQWEPVETACSANERDRPDIEISSPEMHLLLSSLRLMKQISKTRRYNDGEAVMSYGIITEMGALMASLSWVCADLNEAGWFERVMAIRDQKIALLQKRLERAKAEKRREM